MGCLPRPLSASGRAGVFRCVGTPAASQAPPPGRSGAGDGRLRCRGCAAAPMLHRPSAAGRPRRCPRGERRTGGTPARRARRPPRRRDRYGWSAPSCRSRLCRRRRRGPRLPSPGMPCTGNLLGHRLSLPVATCSGQALYHVYGTSPAGQQRNLTLRRPPVVAVRRAPVRREADRARRRAGDLPKMPAIQNSDPRPETPRSDEGCEEDLTGRRGSPPRLGQRRADRGDAVPRGTASPAPTRPDAHLVDNPGRRQSYRRPGAGAPTPTLSLRRVRAGLPGRETPEPSQEPPQFSPRRTPKGPITHDLDETRSQDIPWSLCGVLLYDPRQIVKEGEPATWGKCQRFRSAASYRERQAAMKAAKKET